MVPSGTHTEAGAAQRRLRRRRGEHLPTPTPYLLRRITSLLLAAASVAPIPARAAQVWTALASEKIRPATTARSDASAHIAAARNEFEAFQIVVTGEAGNVRATASELSGPSTLGGIRLYRAALIQVQTASALDGATGPWPDALVPDGGGPSRSRSPRARAAPSGWRCSCRPRRRRASTPAAST